MQYRLSSLAAQLVIALFVCLAPLAANAQTPLSATRDVGGIVKIAGAKPRTLTATLTVWQQEAGGERQAAFRLRADGDVYLFALTRDELLRFIDAIRNYQLAERKPAPASAEVAGSLYQGEVRLQRAGEAARSDRLILDIERKSRQRPTLSLSFASWQPGAEYAPGGSAYKAVTFQYEGALALRDVLQEIAGDLAQR